MKILKSVNVREADNYTIKHEPILSINLMERAAGTCTEKISKLYTFKRQVHLFAGPGNNGGDGLVVARRLYNKGYKVSMHILQFTPNFSEDFTVNLQRLQNETEVPINTIESEKNLPTLNADDILVDSIFGSGLTRPIEGLPKVVVDFMNASELPIIAIDSPSGIRGEENDHRRLTAIKAKYTLTFEFPFLSFFFPENEQYVGEFIIIPIGISEKFTAQAECKNFLLTEQKVKSLLQKRHKFSHKGSYGHGLLISGSYGKAGASVLAAKAAHRSGAGLITAVVPELNYNILQTTSPETMLSIDENPKHISRAPDVENYSATAIGPGIGFHPETVQMAADLILKSKQGIILDADALTILGENSELLKKIPKGSILSPHPKEFERIAGKQTNNYERLEKQKAMAKDLESVIILKGAHTSICMPNGTCYFNSTGNPGMATGGSGDVLTGMLLGLKAQGYSSEKTALIAVFMHGAAGDKAALKTGQTALIASDIIDQLSFKF